jgi:hypothetical protein
MNHQIEFLLRPNDSRLCNIYNLMPTLLLPYFIEDRKVISEIS